MSEKHIQKVRVKPDKIRKILEWHKRVTNQKAVQTTELHDYRRIFSSGGLSSKRVLQK